jgi:XTP/dITP diphosphohydrolase
VAIADPLAQVLVVRGVCEGRIIRRPRGTEGFGYDPVFVPVGYDKTFAELGDEIKNQISHRAKALDEAKKLLSEMNVDKF